MVDFSQTPLDDIISGIGDNENFFKDKVASQFNRQTRPSDLNVLRAYMEHTPYCVDILNLDSKLDKVQVPDQPLYVDFWNKSLETTPDTLAQNNFNRGSSLRYQVVIGDALVEKMSLNRENLQRFDYLGSSSDADVLREKWAATKMYLFTEAYISLLEKYNTAAVTHLNSIISTGGGAGTVYPAGATNLDTKEIPLADKEQRYTGIYTEAMQNKYLYDGEKPMLLSNTTEFLDYNILNAQGANNNADELRAQIALFNHVRSNSLDASVGTYRSISYLMKRGAVAVTSYAQNMAYDAAIPDMQIANKKFARFEMPDIGTEYGIDVAKGIGGLKFNYFENRDVVDTSGTNLTEESILDKDFQMTLWTRPVFVVAQEYDPTTPYAATGQTAVIQYGQQPV